MFSLIPFFIILLLFAGAITLVRYIILTYKGERIAKKITSILIVASIGLILGFYFYTESVKTHYLEFQYNREIKVEIDTYEPDSFLDWPVEFEIKFLNSKDEILKEMEFTTAEGPFIMFYQDSINKNLVHIKGFQQNVGVKDVYLNSNKKSLNDTVYVNQYFELKMK